MVRKLVHHTPNSSSASTPRCWDPRTALYSTPYTVSSALVMTDSGDMRATLYNIGLGQYYDRFVSEGFDRWNVLCDITEADLECFEVKRGHRRILQRAIADSTEGYKGLVFSPNLNQATSTGSSGSDITKQQSHRNVEPNGAVRTKRKYRRHPKPDINAPEKAPSAYVVFSNKIREELKDEGLSFTDMAKAVGQRWQSLPGPERDACEQQAAATKDEYLKQMTEYRKKPEWHRYNQYLAEFKRTSGANSQEAKRSRVASDADIEPSECRERVSRSRSDDDDYHYTRALTITTRSPADYRQAPPQDLISSQAPVATTLHPTSMPLPPLPPAHPSPAYEYAMYRTSYPGDRHRLPALTSRDSFPPEYTPNNEPTYGSHVRIQTSPSSSSSTTQSNHHTTPSHHDRHEPIPSPIVQSRRFDTHHSPSNTVVEVSVKGMAGRDASRDADGSILPQRTLPPPPITGQALPSIAALESPTRRFAVATVSDRWRLPPVGEMSNKRSGFSEVYGSPSGLDRRVLRDRSGH